MKLRRIVKSFSVFLLLGAFFYAASVKEVHYVFSAKYHTAAHTDNCDHHIHSTDKEDDCFICKMDVVGLFHNPQGAYSFNVVFLPKTTISKPDEVVLPTQVQVFYLRGPPSLG